MLACARIGAVHTVVFAGYGAKALNERITGSQAKVVITADSTVRRGGSIPLKPIVEEAIMNAPMVEKVVVLRTLEPKVGSGIRSEWNMTVPGASTAKTAVLKRWKPV